MNKESVTDAGSQRLAEQGTAMPSVRAGTYIDTSVADTGVTGVTVVGSGGKGVFYPDVTSKSDAPLVASKDAEDVAAPALVSVDALYPQWQDGKGEAGMAVRLVGGALKDLEHAINLAGDGTPDFVNHLVLAETQLFQALEKTRFNKAFEIVVHFCAWSLKNAEFQKPNAPSLAGMIAVLRELEHSPFLDVRRSTDLIVGLEDQGWSGQSTIMHMFMDGIDELAASQQEPFSNSGEVGSQAA